jgi:hypothetical protein
MGQSCGPGAAKMKAPIFTLYFTISIALLTLTFRIDEYLRNSTLSQTSTIVSYVIVALLVSVIAAYVAPWTARLLFPSLPTGGWAHATTTAGISFLIFCLVSALFGPLGVDVPGTRVRGIFFSEWKFTNFILYDGVPLAILSGVFRWVLLRSDVK